MVHSVIDRVTLSRISCPPLSLVSLVVRQVALLGGMEGCLESQTIHQLPPPRAVILD